ncbi:MAG: acetate/propionate family kinase [Planctomycetales bacterium]|nr:acetate/propionate family kinase [Planctomycetales bacterium]
MQQILTINAGSSSIKFALFESGKTLERRLAGMIDRIGISGTNLSIIQPTRDLPSSILLADSTRESAAHFLMDWLEKQDGFTSVSGVGHRVVHGMQHTQPELITPELLDDLHRISPYAPEHLPGEIELIEGFVERFPKLLQFACFDTAFHRTMPRVAKLIPIPRRYATQGVERYGFHGLSYAYLMEELERLGEPSG